MHNRKRETPVRNPVVFFSVVAVGIVYGGLLAVNARVYGGVVPLTGVTVAFCAAIGGLIGCRANAGRKFVWGLPVGIAGIAIAVQITLFCVATPRYTVADAEARLRAATPTAAISYFGAMDMQPSTAEWRGKGYVFTVTTDSGQADVVFHPDSGAYYALAHES